MLICFQLHRHELRMLYEQYSDVDDAPTVSVTDSDLANAISFMDPPDADASYWFCLLIDALATNPVAHEKLYSSGAVASMIDAFRMWQDQDSVTSAAASAVQTLAEVGSQASELKAALLSISDIEMLLQGVVASASDGAAAAAAALEALGLSATGSSAAVDSEDISVEVPRSSGDSDADEHHPVRNPSFHSRKVSQLYRCFLSQCKDCFFFNSCSSCFHA